MYDDKRKIKMAGKKLKLIFYIKYGSAHI